jgi:hypothetical protein
MAVAVRRVVLYGVHSCFIAPPDRSSPLSRAPSEAGIANDRSRSNDAQ